MATPLKLRIRTLNQFALNGIKIILFTSRRMKSHSDDVEAVVADVGEITIKWLADNGVIWDELIFGKPLASLYIDDKSADAQLFLEG